MDPQSARRIERLNYILGAVAVGASLLVCTRPQVLGLLVGALLGALNFSAIRRLVERQIEAQKRGAGGFQTALVLPKMLVLIAAVGAAIWFLPIAPVFLALGFSIFMVSIAVETVRFMTNGPVSESADPESLSHEETDN